MELDYFTVEYLNIEYVSNHLLEMQSTLRVFCKNVSEAYLEAEAIYEQILENAEFQKEYLLSQLMDNEIASIKEQHNLMTLIEKIAENSILEHSRMVSETEQIISGLHKRIKV